MAQPLRKYLHVHHAVPLLPRWARSSTAEQLPHKEWVDGSIPSGPTLPAYGTGRRSRRPRLFLICTRLALQARGSPFRGSYSSGGRRSKARSHSSISSASLVRALPWPSWPARAGGGLAACMDRRNSSAEITTAPCCLACVATRRSDVTTRQLRGSGESAQIVEQRIVGRARGGHEVHFERAVPLRA